MSSPDYQTTQEELGNQPRIIMPLLGKKNSASGFIFMIGFDWLLITGITSLRF